MFFDDPRNVLSVARTHQREVLHKEQMDRLARQVDPSTRHAPEHLAAALHWLALRFANGRRLLRDTPTNEA